MWIIYVIIFQTDFQLKSSRLIIERAKKNRSERDWRKITKKKLHYCSMRIFQGRRRRKKKKNLSSFSSRDLILFRLRLLAFSIVSFFILASLRSLEKYKEVPRPRRSDRFENFANFTSKIPMKVIRHGNNFSRCTYILTL